MHSIYICYPLSYHHPLPTLQVLLLAHIPPNPKDATLWYIDFLFNITRCYSKTIIGFITGHSHKDQFRLVRWMMPNGIHYQSFSLSFSLANNVYLSVAGWAWGVQCSDGGSFSDSPKWHKSIISRVLHGQEHFPTSWLSAVPPQSHPGKWYVAATWVFVSYNVNHTI